MQWTDAKITATTKLPRGGCVKGLYISSFGSFDVLVHHIHMFMRIYIHGGITGHDVAMYRDVCARAMIVIHQVKK